MLNSYKFYKLFSLSFKLGIKPVFLYFIFLFNTAFSQQNLVPNGDFEDYITCPSIDPPYHYVDRANHWFMPTLGSSDYYNVCSDYFDSTLGYYFFSVPQNYIGFQEARSGYGYAGYYAVNSQLNDNYHEYLSVKLNKPLEKGHLYRLTYYISLAELALGISTPLQFIDHSGAFLSNEALNIDNWLRINEQPQVQSKSSIFLNDSTGWQKIEGTFIAEGSEKFLTIGCFLRFENISYNYLSEESPYVLAYYYVDDVSLIEIDLSFPNVFSPNGDGINDVVFQGESFGIFEIEILNRWGSIVFTAEEGNGWSGYDQNGRQLDDGVYYFSVKNDNNILKTGFIHLIR